jgi:hypothetical protein
MNWDSVGREWKERRGKAVNHGGNIVHPEITAVS